MDRNPGSVAGSNALLPRCYRLTVFWMRSSDRIGARFSRIIKVQYLNRSPNSLYTGSTAGVLAVAGTSASFALPGRLEPPGVRGGVMNSVNDPAATSAPDGPGPPPRNVSWIRRQGLSPRGNTSSGVYAGLATLTTFSVSPVAWFQAAGKRQTRREAVTQSHGPLEGGETAGLPKGGHLGITPHPVTPHRRDEPGRSRLSGSGRLGRA